MIHPADIRDLLLRFTGPDLTQTLARIESAVRGVEAKDCESFLESAGVGREVLAAAVEMKRLAGQINVTIRALGILLCLPHNRRVRFGEDRLHQASGRSNRIWISQWPSRKSR